MKFKLQFPCGFIYEEDGLFIINSEEIDKVFEFGCPLHGKKCKGY